MAEVVSMRVQAINDFLKTRKTEEDLDKANVSLNKFTKYKEKTIPMHVALYDLIIQEGFRVSKRRTAGLEEYLLINEKTKREIKIEKVQQQYCMYLRANQRKYIQGVSKTVNTNKRVSVGEIMMKTTLSEILIREDNFSSWESFLKYMDDLTLNPFEMDEVKIYLDKTKLEVNVYDDWSIENEGNLDLYEVYDLYELFTKSFKGVGKGTKHLIKQEEKALAHLDKRYNKLAELYKNKHI